MQQGLGHRAQPEPERNAEAVAIVVFAIAAHWYVRGEHQHFAARGERALELRLRLGPVARRVDLEPRRASGCARDAFERRIGVRRQDEGQIGSARRARERDIGVVSQKPERRHRRNADR